MNAISATISAASLYLSREVSQPQKKAGPKGPALPAPVVMRAEAGHLRPSPVSLAEKRDAAALIAKMRWDELGEGARKNGLEKTGYADLVRDRGLVTATNLLRSVSEGKMTAKDAMARPSVSPGPGEPGALPQMRPGRAEPEKKSAQPADRDLSVAGKRDDALMRKRMAGVEADIAKKMSSYSKRLVTHLGMTAEQANRCATADLGVVARVSSAVSKETGTGPAGKGPVGTQAGPAIADPRMMMTAKVMSSIRSQATPLRELREDEALAPDSAPKMDAYRYDARMDRREPEISGPGI